MFVYSRFFHPKGQAFVNNFNAGRYWPSVGPQETLYIPKSALSTGAIGNSVVLFEIDEPVKGHDERFIEFVDKPIWKDFL